MARFDKVGEVLKALPVSAVAADVVKSVQSGKVTVLAAPTGSGKSMLVPAMLSDAVDDQVVVLVPRRFLATDAAENVAKMAGVPLGADVGFAIGEMSGEKSKSSKETKLLFATYGYAISSGLINSAKHIVLDEVHEAAEDISLARAILHERKHHEPDLQLLEMSATMNAKRQAAYWDDISKNAVHAIKGQTLACEEPPYNADISIAETVVNLLSEQKRNGVAVFCAGIQEIERTVKEIKVAAEASGIKNLEVAQIYSGTPSDEKAKALAAPKRGWKKVIVGTNVIESGMNIRWLDSGVSDGTGKIPYDRKDTGAYALVPEDLPQDRLIQQRGRINRDSKATGFESGIYVLHSRQPFEHRAQQATPELERRSLTGIAFQAASLGYNPETLKMDAQVEPWRWREAKEELIRLGLVDDSWALTRQGQYVAGLPLSPEAGAMLCEAHRLDTQAARSGDVEARKRQPLIGDAIIIAVLVEQGGLRKDYKKGHGLEGKSDVHGASDVMDGLKAYLKLESEPVAEIVAESTATLAEGDPDKLKMLEAAREQLKKKCEALNVSYTGFCEAMELVNNIRGRLKVEHLYASDYDAFDATRYNLYKQIMLHGSVNRLFQLEPRSGAPTYRDVLRDYGRERNYQGERFGNYGITKFSTLTNAQETSFTPLVVGKLQEFRARDSMGVNTVLNQVTSIPAEVFMAWAMEHNPPLLDKVKVSENELTGRYAGKGDLEIALPTTGQRKKTATALAEKLKKQSISNGSWEEYARNSRHDRGIS